MSNKSSECLVNWNWTVYKVYGEQDKSGENSSKFPVVSSLFPHPWLGAHNYMLKITDQFSVQDCMSIQYILLSSYGKYSVGNSNSKKYVCITSNNWTYTY